MIFIIIIEHYFPGRDMCSVHNPCLHGGVCVNSKEEDKVTCKCRARFAGDRCEVDKCANCDPNAYCHHGNCMCKPDFVGNGYVCKGMDIFNLYASLYDLEFVDFEFLFIDYVNFSSRIF